MFYLFRDANTISHLQYLVKAAATDMRYFARSKFCRSLVYEKNLT